MLAGCATIEEDARKNDFEKITRAYAKTLEWSQYENLPSFVQVQEGETPPDPAAYQAFKVTGYQPGRGDGAADGMSVRRTAKISYIVLSRMSERSVVVHEEWVYSEPRKRWFLKTGLPVFH